MTPLSLGSAWTRRGIQTRVLLLVGIGILAALATLGGTAWMGLNVLATRLADERAFLAGSVARHLDYVLQGELGILQGVSSAAAFDLTDDQTAAEEAALREAYLRSQLAHRVFLAGPDAVILLSEPGGLGPEAPPLEGVRSALTTGRPTISDLRSSPRDRGLYLLVPIRDWRGQVVAVAGSEIDPSGSRFAGILQPFGLSGPGSVGLIDGAGTLIATTGRSPRFETVRNWDGMAPSVRERAARVITVEEPDAAVIALAPLASARWAVVIREASSTIFEPVTRLRATILWLGPALLAVALLFAWGAARSVRRPIGLLTIAAERIAAGNLDTPMPRLADDEVGRLGRSLERMRVELRHSIDGIAEANRDLEQRVDARTSELNALYRKLQEREEWREELLRKVISAQEDERRRLARELHDETSQTLSALAMKIETALTAWPTNASRDRLLEAKTLTVRTIEELHRLIFDLRPSVLDDLGLLSAIRWYAERHLERRGITVHFEFSGAEGRKPPELETALFRVVQETITNIAKHARAETVLIQILERDDQVSIEIEDDGEGFDPASLPPPAARERGLGLLGMRERVELFGGTFEIDSAPGSGTRIAITVPLHQEVPDAQDSRPHRG